MGWLRDNMRLKSLNRIDEIVLFRKFNVDKLRQMVAAAPHSHGGRIAGAGHRANPWSRTPSTGSRSPDLLAARQLHDGDRRPPWSTGTRLRSRGISRRFGSREEDSGMASLHVANSLIWYRQSSYLVPVFRRVGTVFVAGGGLLRDEAAHSAPPFPI